MENGKTVTDAKAAFIRTQVRLLSAPLQASAQWRDFAPETEEGPMSNKLAQEVVSKVNDKIKQHNRMVFSAPSQRHVAEQIESLYWTGIASTGAHAEDDAVTVKTATDLASAEGIQTLPDDPNDLPMHSDQAFDDEDSSKYKELHDQLVALGQRRDQQQSRLVQYRQLQVLLRPFENAQENIQPNLVTRDGELSKELDRMRILLARVTGRISEVKDTNTPKNLPQEVATNEQKLATVMDLT